MKTWISVVIAIVLVVAGWYYFAVYRAGQQEVSTPPAVVEATPEAVMEVEEPVEVAPPQPEPEPEFAPEPQAEPEPLPALADSDAAAADAIGSLLGEALATRYVTGEDTISKAVATVDALDSKQVPASILAVIGPDGPFEATADESPATPILNEQGDPIPQFVLDPVNYRRYLVYVEMLEAVDAERAGALFQRYYPLLQEAYGELGYPEASFEDRLIAIIDELLATPDVGEPVRLMKPEAYYLFVDEELEALSAGQKMLIRMGPANAARVKAKLVEIRSALVESS